ncbi:signal peptidase II [Altericroceibacterium xinjiangense]|uniref:signal peptidase II n=1 Tax=Altericroceibacterium xinjiangense TaxID=762261 RepID=UPI001F4940BF|nr:signal peptidase II [Altericroceibacterium xinjiangense]
MSPVTRNRVAGLVLAAVIAIIDQVVKYIVVGPLRLREVGHIDLLPFFDFTFTPNYGISLGLFTATSMEMRWILVVVTGLIAAAVMVWMLRERRFGDIAPLALILGGALGNIRDRFVLGYVIDYADLHIGSFRPFLIFNIADAAITIGVVLLLLRSLFIRDKPEDATSKPENAAEIP